MSVYNLCKREIQIYSFQSVAVAIAVFVSFYVFVAVSVVIGRYLYRDYLLLLDFIFNKISINSAFICVCARARAASTAAATAVNSPHLIYARQ